MWFGVCELEVKMSAISDQLQLVQWLRGLSKVALFIFGEYAPCSWWNRRGAAKVVAGASIGVGECYDGAS